MKVIVTVSTNRVGSQVTSEFEIDDDWTQEEIEEYAQQTMFDMISWDYEVTEGDDA